MPNGPFYGVGLHVGQVVAQGLTRTKTGNPQFVLKLKVLGVPEGDQVFAHQQQYDRTVYMVLTEKTVEFVKDTLDRIGFPANASIAQLDPGAQGFHDFSGQRIELWCKHEQDQQGQLRERWQVSNGGGSAGVAGDALDQREMRQLDSLFGRSRQAAPVSRPQPTADYVDQGITDDDIPF